MSWLTDLLGIGDTQKDTGSWISKLLGGKEDEEKRLRGAYLDYKPIEMDPTQAPGPMKVPDNYLGGKFIPPDDPRFNGTDLPTRETLSYLEKNILGQTREAGLPDQLVATQWANEGARNTNPPGNNPFGLGPGNEYDSVEDATKVYINTVLNNSGLGETGEDGILRLKAGITADELIDALAGKYEMHNPNKYDYGNSLKRTPEWRFYGE